MEVKKKKENNVIFLKLNFIFIKRRKTKYEEGWRKMKIQNTKQRREEEEKVKEFNSGCN